MIKHNPFRFSLLLVLLAFAAQVVAHPATERYIPIGKSPGISGKHSYVGTIESRDDVRHTMSMRAAGGMTSLRMGETTKIYLDRSALRKTNLKGSYSDCRPGRRIEVKFIDNDPSKPAEWIKVEIKN